MAMTICVIGAGALGSGFGALLSESGNDVVLLTRRHDQAEELNRRGLMVTQGLATREVRVKATAESSDVGQVELAIVLVKSTQTRAAILGAQAVIGNDTAVLSIQNGLGNEEIIGDIVGADKVLGGRTYVGSIMVAPGHIDLSVQGKETYIGELNGEATSRLERICEVFNRAGLATEASSNIIGMMWDKLLVNLPTGALSGITGLPYGELYEIPEIRRCAFEVIREGMAIADELGVVLGERDPEVIWQHAGVGLPPSFKASMLQSLEKGEMTEIDYINGSVARLGLSLGLPTPANDAMIAGIKGIERFHQLGRSREA